MPVLNIRNLPERVHSWLRVRAARNNRSMEAEARKILKDQCDQDLKKVAAESVQQWVSDLYGDRKPRGVVEELIADRRREAEGE